MNAVIQRQDLEESLAEFTQQERLRLIRETSERTGRDLPAWFVNAEIEADKAVQDRSVRNTIEVDQADLKFGDLARGPTAFETLTDKSMFRGSGLQLPNALRPPKLKIMPKSLF
jgi:hypothetical protein